MDEFKAGDRAIFAYLDGDDNYMFLGRTDAKSREELHKAIQKAAQENASDIDFEDVGEQQILVVDIVALTKVQQVQVMEVSFEDEHGTDRKQVFPDK